MAPPKSKPAADIMYRPNRETVDRIDQLILSGHYTDRVNVIDAAVQRMLEWDSYMAVVSATIERSLQTPEVARVISDAIVPLVRRQIKDSL